MLFALKKYITLIVQYWKKIIKKKQDKLYKLFEMYNFAKNFSSTKHIYARISLFTKVFTKIDTHIHVHTHRKSTNKLY